MKATPPSVSMRYVPLVYPPPTGASERMVPTSRSIAARTPPGRPTGRPRRVDLEALRPAAPRDLVAEHRLGHRRPADVARTHEQDADRLPRPVVHQLQLVHLQRFVERSGLLLN